jgi:lysophospholipase L1-like esterase
MATISSLAIPQRFAELSAGYPLDAKLTVAKINELAMSLGITPLTINPALGTGDPAADMMLMRDKVNEILSVVNAGGGGSTPTNTAPSVVVQAVLTATGPKLTATAADSDGVNSIFIKVYDANGALAQTFGPSAPGDLTYVTTWAAAPVGVYTARAIATDTKGLSSAPSDPASFTVSGAPAAPAITGFSPTTGTVGGTVMVAGTALSGVTGATIGGVAAPITSNSATSVGLTIPTGAKTGTISLTTAAGTATSASSFTVLATPAWNGKPGNLNTYGDSRTYGTGSTTPASDSYPAQLLQLMLAGAGAGNYTLENQGQPSQGTDFALSAVYNCVTSKRDAANTGAQLCLYFFGVNDQLHNPSWPVEQSLENDRQAIAQIIASGYGVIVILEPYSQAFDANPTWFHAYNNYAKAHCVADWGCFDYVDLENLASIQNYNDTSVSPDKLHYTRLGYGYIAQAVLPKANAYFASKGIPTSTSGGNGGKTTPSAPTLSYSGRTITATAGNGLAASTLRYTVKGGSEQTGSSYTVPDATSLATGDLVFRSVASGNYTDSPSASNMQAIAAVNTSVLYNSDFTQPFTSSISSGWVRTNDYGDGREQVTVGDGAAHFKGIQYDAITQQLHSPTGQAPAGNYKAIVVVNSISGGRFSLQNKAYGQGSALNESVNTVGTHEYLFTAAGPGEVVSLKAEDAVTADVASLIVVPV